MLQQLAVPPQSAMAPVGAGHLAEVLQDITYRRVLMVNVVFCGVPGAGDRGWVLVDTGLSGSAGPIRRAAAARFGEGARPAAIILTHGHFDHVGAVERLAADWDAPVYAHPLEHPYLDGRARYPSGDGTVGGGLMAVLAPLYPRGPINLGDRLRLLPADGSVPGMPGWRWIHTPGHSVGHISLWREADATLIAGDAVITTAQESLSSILLQYPELHGPPKYYTIDWQAAASSTAALARLRPLTMVTGHGPSLSGAHLADVLDRLAQEFAEIAVPRRGRYRSMPAVVDDGSAYRPL
ncbi:MBL fold metallo-hydrolase [Mesorhizobium sp. BR1-1-16]|uniref:MBL fold metallo-hydrolase n=1 Tax=Mesorhizobium sp. BR1-1-16 TaxID=2876653 RepID=UPI001CCAAD28|nr:MBL fold metallo-hydrolase [Mesorhizobium sp. BR1-1-16]MBZ9936945.1 MBL fold metallo-hydrolase [Mesorhizobium sp. BR1-1-16]